MHRTVLFRAKRTKADDPQERFIEGSLLSFQDIHGKRVYSIVSDAGMRNDIQADTLGEFTGLKDKSGTPIFEGDIVKCNEFVYKVAYDDKRFASFVLIRKQDMFRHYFGEAMDASACEIIGNVYDNPELLK